ncbi:GGDEF domain-containing protein [Anoxybacterium hadale]|uniref:GGDEF domain-containing protein n=1 Tax=Anoxybacterium hadale TaxID=3408580 RepID=A0ACD1A9I8_9FIRM|nr:GGDEF domain-containing protein [Clostridiales bacterium]
MDRKLKLKVNILISLIIFAGFAAVAFTSYHTYSKIIEDDIVNISKLTSTNIYSDIRNELTKPIFVSLTMANDSFLKGWLESEKANDTLEHQLELRQYLLGLKKKYNYDSVFLVSESSKNYYHFNGLNKVISDNNDHDIWYYEFVNSDYVYDLDVDTDEANKGSLSVFVNCRMTDEDGKLLGVTGVGLELDQVQSLLKAFEDDYNLDALLFGEDGTVQINTSLNDISTENVFDAEILSENREKILNNHDSLQVLQFKEQSFHGYYIVRYIEELNWYLLIKKDTSVLASSMYAQTTRDALIYTIVVLLVLIITNGIVKKNDQLMLGLLRTDLLTGLPNRRNFNETLAKAINITSEQESLFVFVFDLDNFKHVNDTQGHLKGDQMLQEISRFASEAFSKKGLVCRWGGDEFAGYCFSDRQEVIKILEAFFEIVRKDPSFKLYNMSVSLGITRALENDNEDALIYRADQALYQAKANGKDNWVMDDEKNRI